MPLRFRELLLGTTVTITLALTGPAMAHHPGGTSNASEAGPIYTIPVYRPQLVRHLIACYAASAADESWFCRMAAGVWNPCRSMSQLVL
jgi:hypothetical protein